MAEITYGGKRWSNLDALMCDAANYQYQKERADRLERLLSAAVTTAGGKLRVSEAAFAAAAGTGVETPYNPNTQSYYITSIRRP